jgi:bis(5'-nucleosyl)-tetraphosphatase (symmetrical)
MSTYVIGDIQGCHETLMRLVQRIRFDPRTDRLWFVGDLVNRGPQSLEVLRWVRGLGEAAITVLGNHDLHLLALADGLRKAKRRDTLQQVLDAPDRNELIHWLRHRPLLHREPPYLLVHAGLMPSWTEEHAEELARDVQETLRSERAWELLRWFQEGHPVVWSDDLKSVERLRVSLAVLTRLRTCTSDGRLCLEHAGPPAEAPAGCHPWFSLPGRRSAGTVVLFGHWSTLGLLQTPQAIGLDTGCLWGGALSAMRLEDRRIFQEPAAPADRISVD